VYLLARKTLILSKCKVLQKNVPFDFLCNYCLKYFSFWEELSEYSHKCTNVIMQNTRYTYHILTIHKFCRHILQKYSVVIFYGNPSSGSRVVPWGRTDMTRRIFALRYCVNASKKTHLSARVSLIPLYQQIIWQFTIHSNQIFFTVVYTWFKTRIFSTHRHSYEKEQRIPGLKRSFSGSAVMAIIRYVKEIHSLIKLWLKREGN
jgi:hypothetical protein